MSNVLRISTLSCLFWMADISKCRNYENSLDETHHYSCVHLSSAFHPSLRAVAHSQEALNKVFDQPIFWLEYYFLLK